MQREPSRQPETLLSLQHRGVVKPTLNLCLNTCDVGLSIRCSGRDTSSCKNRYPGHGCPDGQYMRAAVTTQCRKKDRTQGTQHGSIPKLREHCWKDLRLPRTRGRPRSWSLDPCLGLGGGGQSERSSISPLVSHRPRKGPVWKSGTLRIKRRRKWGPKKRKAER